MCSLIDLAALFGDSTQAEVKEHSKRTTAQGVGGSILIIVSPLGDQEYPTFYFGFYCCDKVSIMTKATRGKKWLGFIFPVYIL